MGVFGFFSYNKTESFPAEKALQTASTDATRDQTAPTNGLAGEPDKLTPRNLPVANPTYPGARQTGLVSRAPLEVATNAPEIKRKRFSFRPFSFNSEVSSDTKPFLSAAHEHERRVKASQDLEKRILKVQLSKSDKRARQSALAIRSLIVGSASAAAPQITSATAKPQLSALKTQLMEPKSANKLIMQLRTLPAHDEVPLDHGHHPKGPIHAVCLEHTDEEEHQFHFAKLVNGDRTRSVSVEIKSFQGVASAPLEQITNLFNEMHVIDLVHSPDFGLGQPGNGKGILAGAVPTAETVIQGFKQITPELMALGYATGKVITPDHSGLHPPTDRMSILTYWWGFELLLPPPSLLYLTKAQSVSGSLMNFLSALALVNNGVREILPFIRYIAQFVDFEFSAIKKQDKGHGVVCAATWIIPAALVPRPWDFPLFSEVPSGAGSNATTISNSLPPPSSILDLVGQSSTPTTSVKTRGTLIKAAA